MFDTKSLPSPTNEMMQSLEFKAVWECIKNWDINIPDSYEGYCGANGSHVVLILEALRKSEAA